MELMWIIIPVWIVLVLTYMALVSGSADRNRRYDEAIVEPYDGPIGKLYDFPRRPVALDDPPEFLDGTDKGWC